MRKLFFPIALFVGFVGVHAGTAQAEGTQTNPGPVEITPYMPCKTFMDTMAADAARAKIDYSQASNRIFERHISDMMEMLQPYAVVDKDGKPLDYTWSFLVNKTGEYCKRHPDGRLDDAVHYAGASIFEVYKKAKDSLIADENKHQTDKMPAASDLGEDAPPTGIPGNSVN